MADKYIFPAAVPVMQSIPLAILVFPAFGALPGFSPAPVSECLKFSLPDFIKTVAVDITL
jgi:hypothetical protein